MEVQALCRVVAAYFVVLAIVARLLVLLVVLLQAELLAVIELQILVLLVLVLLIVNFHSIRASQWLVLLRTLYVIVAFTFPHNIISQNSLPGYQDEPAEPITPRDTNPIDDTDSPGTLTPHFSDIINPEKRAAIREALRKGEPLPRPVKPTEETYLKEAMPKAQMDTAIRRLDRAIRWNTMQTHVNINCNDVVDSVTGGKVDLDTQDFAVLRNKVTENVRSYKNKTINNFIVSVLL